MRRAFAVVAVLVAVAQRPAVAHDHVPPEATLRTAGATQHGTRIASCWIRGKDLGGAAVCRQEPTSFPETIGAGAAATILFHTEREPHAVRLRAWRRLRPDGEPRRPARRLAVTVKPTSDGWRVRFDVPGGARPWYLEVRGVWTDARFEDSHQFALWSFSLRGR